MRIAGICRVSTEAQARKGESLREQHKGIENAAAVLGHTVVAWYEGQEHATPGYERAILARFLRDAETDQWDAVMVLDTSRWSRKNEDSKRGIRILNDNRKRFFAGTQEIPIQRALGRQMLGMQVEMHEGTAGHLVEQSLVTKIARMVEGRPSIGMRRFGRKWTPEKGWDRVDAEVKVFKRAVAMVYKGDSLQKISETLGCTAQGWLYRFRTAGGSRIVRAKDELGNQREFKQEFPALLSDSEQRRLLARLTANRMNGRGKKKNGSFVQHYLLRGKARCAACNQTLRGMPTKWAHGHLYSHHMVIGPDHKPKPRLPGCVKTVRGKDLEYRVFEQLTKILSQPEELAKGLAEALDHSGLERETLEAELVVLRREKTALEKQLDHELTLISKIDKIEGRVKARVQDRLNTLNDKLRTVDEQVVSAASKLEHLNVRSEEVQQVQQMVDYLIGKNGRDANGWRLEAKKQLLDILFGPGSLRRQKDEIGIYVKADGTIDRIKGHFVISPEGYADLAAIAQDGFYKPALKPKGLRVSKTHAGFLQWRTRRSRLLEQPPPRQHQRGVVRDDGIRGDDRDVQRDVLRKPIEHQRPRNVDRVLERQHVRDMREPRRHLRHREEDAGEKQHRRHHERHEVGEEVVARRERIHHEPERAEAEPDEEAERQHEQREPGVAEAERLDHREDRRRRHHGFRRAPDPLGEHDVVERDRRVDDRVPRALNVHAREGRVHALEARGEHRALADHAGADERDIGHAVDLADQRADAVADGEHVEQRIGDVAEHAGDRKLAPDEKIPPPHGDEAQRQSRHPEHAFERRIRCHG